MQPPAIREDEPCDTGCIMFADRCWRSAREHDLLCPTPLSGRSDATSESKRPGRACPR